VQHSAVQHNTPQCSALQWSTAQCSKVLKITMQ